jgi:hypothetical protein
MTLESRLVSVVQAIGADVKDLYIKTNTYVYTQAVPSATWTITHNLGKHPSVAIVDSAGTVVEGDIIYDSNNQVTASFVGGFSGVAYLN